MGHRPWMVSSQTWLGVTAKTLSSHRFKSERQALVTIKISIHLQQTTAWKMKFKRYNSSPPKLTDWAKQRLVHSKMHQLIEPPRSRRHSTHISLKDCIWLSILIWNKNGREVVLYCSILLECSLRGKKRPCVSKNVEAKLTQVSLLGSLSLPVLSN